jgi:hypothetical protein
MSIDSTHRLFRSLAKKKRWTESDGRKAVDAWKASGRSIYSFARSSGSRTGGSGTGASGWATRIPPRSSSPSG